MTSGAGIFRKSFFAILMTIMVISWNIPAYSQDTKAQEERRARLEREIAIIDAQLKTNAKESSSALGKLTLIRKKVASRKELVQESDRKIALYSKSIAEKEKEVKAIQGRLDTLTLYYSKIVKSAYKNRNPKIWYMYILASEDIGQGLRRYGYLRDLSKQMNVQAKKIIQTKETLEEEMGQLETLKREAEAVRARRVEEMKMIQGEEEESRQVVDRLNRDKKKYQKQLSDKKKEVEALNREIDRIIRETMNGGKASSGSKGKPKQTIDYKLAGQFESNKGKLPWPADGPVVDHFGQHYHPVYTNVKLPFNNGVTIALAPGTDVNCVFDGVVKQIVVMPGYSKCVLVQHGSYFTFYCKMGSVNVKAGDKVKTNQKIGTVDTIGGETQLHFQIWSGRNPQDPESWLRP